MRVATAVLLALVTSGACAQSVYVTFDAPLIGSITTEDSTAHVITTQPLVGVLHVALAEDMNGFLLQLYEVRATGLATSGFPGVFGGIGGRQLRFAGVEVHGDELFSVTGQNDSINPFENPAFAARGTQVAWQDFTEKNFLRSAVATFEVPVLATPAPEPEVSALLLVGLGMLGLRLRKS